MSSNGKSFLWFTYVDRLVFLYSNGTTSTLVDHVFGPFRPTTGVPRGLKRDQCGLLFEQLKRLVGVVLKSRRYILDASQGRSSRDVDG
jgi:hypothetical protein